MELETQIEADIRKGYLDAFTIPVGNLLKIDQGEISAIKFQGSTYSFRSATRLAYDAITVHVNSEGTGASFGHNLDSDSLVTIYTYA